MNQRALVCLLLAGMAWGQTAGAPPTLAQRPAGATTTATTAEASALPPDAPVITITGVCDSSKQGSDCKTVISRADFEKLVATIAPKLPPMARRQFADRYAKALVTASAAEKAGLAQGPKYDEMMRVQRLTVLGQLMNQDIQEKASQISDKDVEDYYNNNKAAFEEVGLQKIFIPKAKQEEPDKNEKPLDKMTQAEQDKKQAEDDKKQKESEAAMKTVADSILKKANAGGDFAKLQQEAYDAAGIKAKPPAQNADKIRRTSLPPNQAEDIMKLKSGEVSPLFTEQSGYFIYKMGDRDTVALDKVKEEIRGTLRSQKMKDLTQQAQASATTTLDPNYFAPPAGGPGAQGPPPPPGMMKMPMKPATTQPATSPTK